MIYNFKWLSNVFESCIDKERESERERQGQKDLQIRPKLQPLCRTEKTDLMREGETGRGKRSIIEMSCILIFIRISSFERAGGERNEGTENEYIIYIYMYIYSYI